jgi:ribonuclease HI
MLEKKKNKMSKSIKYYVVWQGKKPGIYNSWQDCQEQIHGVKTALYKSFESKIEADKAFAGKPEDYIQKKSPSATTKGKKTTKGKSAILWDSISVDAACSGNPGLMEYQGVDTKSKERIFHQGPFLMGTNNIGEFLAIVHALALYKQKGLTTRPIYTDSVTAMGWVKKKKANTKLEQNAKTAKLYELIQRAETWLQQNTYSNPIIKWETEDWGEIPADFGRK